jgi:Fe-Mn family superoxide dismutase
MNSLTRRTLIQVAAVSPAIVAAAAEPVTSAGPPDNAAAFSRQHSPVPLPFDAKSLKGISEKLIQSHWENNYVGASKALNTVRGRLAQALADANTPPYVYNGLKREQAIRTGSVVLHEFYFGNLGGDGKAPANLRTKLAESFGSYDRWESEFRRSVQDSAADRAGWCWLQRAPQIAGKLLAGGSLHQPGIHQAGAGHGHV